MSETKLDDDLDGTDAWLISAARELDPPSGEVERLISSITTKVADAIRPALTLPTDSPRVMMSDRVVKTLCATRIRTAVGRLVVSAQVRVDEQTGEATGLRIGLVARYHDDLPALSERVRDIVEEILIGTLGDGRSSVARADIHVRWQDVYSRDWLN